MGVSEQTDMTFVGVSNRSGSKLLGGKKQSDIKLLVQKKATPTLSLNPNTVIYTESTEQIRTVALRYALPLKKGSSTVCKRPTN